MGTRSRTPYARRILALLAFVPDARIGEIERLGGIRRGSLTASLGRPSIPRLGLLRGVADVLGTSLDYLCGRDPEVWVGPPTVDQVRAALARARGQKPEPGLLSGAGVAHRIRGLLRCVSDSPVREIERLGGIPRGSLQASLDRGTVPSTSLLLGVADVLGASLDYLCGRDPEVWRGPPTDAEVQDALSAARRNRPSAIVPLGPKSREAA